MTIVTIARMPIDLREWALPLEVFTMPHRCAIMMLVFELESASPTDEFHGDVIGDD